ncbi:oligopeptide/dipeptide ABC transporter ATP-binding protein, partial [[Clostridium] symbiosum]
LYSIQGTVPDIRNFPPGCRFCTRCPFVLPVCKEKEPPFVKLNEKHFVRCHRAEEIAKGGLIDE